MEFIQKESAYYFKDISEYEIFGYAGKYYLKIPRVSTAFDSKKYNAIDLTDKRFTVFEGDVVTKYKATVTLEKIY